MKRALRLALVSVLIAGASSAAGATPRRCPDWHPTAAPGARDQEAAVDAPVLRVAERHTEADPLTVSYEHETAASYVVNTDLQDADYFNLIIDSQTPMRLHILAEWEMTTPADVDLWLYDGKGKTIRGSAAWNIPGLDDKNDDINREYMEAVRTRRCGHFSLESTSGRSIGTPVMLKVWLEPDPEGDGTSSSQPGFIEGDIDFERRDTPCRADMVPDDPGIAGVTDDGAEIGFDVLVLLDDVPRNRAETVVDRMSDAYAPLNIALRPTYRTVQYHTDNAKLLFPLMLDTVGGRRPERFDAVHLLSGKDVHYDGDDIFGIASCIGGIASDFEAFSISEGLNPDEGRTMLVEPLRQEIETSAVVMAHELGHLFGAWHEYGNCVEAAADDDDDPTTIRPCTAMHSGGSIIAPKFGQLESAVIRGAADAYIRP